MNLKLFSFSFQFLVRNRKTAHTHILTQERKEDIKKKIESRHEKENQIKMNGPMRYRLPID